ncbi:MULTISPECIES: DUF1385 domain-containing protein [Vallitalea]|uniref:DUF1385 domain-containing protein n=2 Tax=Vallitalea TaxID=1348611 RepID=A0A8J8M8L0_9FIRM|nr:DUF1385 domain-containing protein [Vallitalea guaymasensis]QUH28397.1 DUF1385 domain-containing protein [Vallitalea guaymasensis]GMQ63925.1 DUF1385 domain-containing protein [Vallitalea sp. AN17-2]
MKPVDIGGQAVIEGVMMKNKNTYAVAVRKPDKEIIIDKREYTSFSEKVKLFKLPIFRGMLAFVESLIIGMKILTYSAEFFEVEDEKEKEPGKFDRFLTKVFGDKLDKVVVGFSVVLSIILAIGLFVLLPLGLSQLVKDKLPNESLINLVDGVIRVVIFLVYLKIISLMKDIQRVFQYHGAEHKSINCLEHEEELTVENIKKHSRYHKRCGTNFLLIVVLMSILVLMIIDVRTFWLRFAVRLLCLPLIAGLSYEIIKWLGRSESKLAAVIAKPGLWLQRLTTREPDGSQIEVAIASLKGVLVNDEEDHKERIG